MHCAPSISMACCLPRRKQGIAAAARGRGIKIPGCYAVADFVLGLASPGSFPCPENSPAYSLQFSARTGAGHYLAFGTEWGRLVIVDTRTEAGVQRDQHGPVGSPEAIIAGGRARSWTEGGRWGVAQPSVVADYRVLSNCVFDLEWIKEDRYIALACGDGMCRLQHTETQTEVMVLTGHAGSVKTISANPIDEGVLLTGSRDGSFALWDTRLLHRSKPDVEGLHEANPPGRLLFPIEKVYGANSFAGDSRKRPRLRVVKERAKPSKSRNSSGDQLPHRSVTSVEWMPDGQKFLTAGQDGLVKLWDTRYAFRPLQEACPAEDIAASPGRDRASRPALSPVSSPPHPSGPPSANALKSVIGATSVWGNWKLPGDSRVPKRRSQRVKGARCPGQRMESKGGISGGEAIAQEAAEGTGRLYGVSSVHVCDDGSRVAVCTVKSHISVYAYTSGSLRNLGSFTGNQNSSSYYIKAKLSPDGSLLASGSTDDAVCLWRVDSPGTPVARLMGHANEVTGVDWCRSEALKLATCSDDETVRVWTVDPRRVACSNTPTALQPPPLPTTNRSETEAPIVATLRGLSTGSFMRMAEARVGESGDFEVSANGKFGPGIACVGENEWWKRMARERTRTDIENVAGVRAGWKRKNKHDGAVGSSDLDLRLPQTQMREVSPRRLPVAVARDPALRIATPTAAPTTKASGNAPYPDARVPRPDDDSHSRVRAQTASSREAASTTALASVFAQCSPSKEAGAATRRGDPSTVTGGFNRVYQPSDENARPDGVSATEAPLLSGNAIAEPSNSMGLAGGQTFPFTSNFDLPERRLLETQLAESTRSDTSRNSRQSDDMDLASSGSNDGVHERCMTEPGSVFPLRRLPLVASARTSGRKSRMGARERQQQLRQGLRQGARKSLSPTARGSTPRQRHTLMSFWNGDQETQSKTGNG